MDNINTEEYGLFIDLDLTLENLDKLKKLNKELEKFKNGLLIFDLVDFETYPVIYRKKTISAHDLPEIILNLNETIKKNDFKKLSITTVDSYLFINNNILIFKIT